MKNKSVIIASIFIFMGAIFRLLPHPPNATPLAAMAFAGGIYLNRKYLAFLLPLVALFFSDFILNNTINRGFFTDQTGVIFFSDYMIWVYLAFILTVGIGLFLKKYSTGQRVLFGTLFSSLAFYIITNFGTWLMSDIYPNTIAGLIASFGMAVPFFRNTLISNAIFIPLFVLSIDFMISYSHKKKLA